MRHYELVVILSPMLNQDQVVETWDRIKEFISTREAEISHEEQWGTRRLAYPIRKGQNQFLEGSYHLTRFATEQAFNRELETFLKVDDEVLRAMVTVTLPEDELAAQAAAAARAIRPPPPRPAPVDQDGAPLAPPPAEGAAPVTAADPTEEGQAPVAVAESDVPVVEAEAPAVDDEAEATVATAEEVETPVADDEPEPATPEEEPGPAPEGTPEDGPAETDESEE